MLDDLPALLHEILAGAERITGADKGNIQLLEADGLLRIEAQHGFSKEFLDFFNAVGQGDDAACSTAFARRERVVVDDVERSPIFAGTPALKVLLDAGVRAVQSTPIVSQDGVVIGMLSTHYATVRQPSDRDLRLIDLLARQTADLIIRHRAEEALRAANAALVRANEDLNQFAFAASHDLQEPLRMITTYAQLLVKTYPGELEGEAQTYADFMTEGTKRMRDLLADLLDFTRLSGEAETAIEWLDLNLVFEKTIENCRTAIEESQAAVTSDPLPRVPGHEPHFLQLFQNLIGNALKYRSTETPRIHVSAVKENGTWRFAVADNGIGIDPEYHKDIFGVFKRLHGKSVPGTGIGLAICKRVAERYGGRIWVESQENLGSTFYFTIPIGKGASA